MKNAVFVAFAAILLMLSQSFIWLSVTAFQLPGAQNSLVTELKLELPEKLVPVMLAYYPELNAITYESSVGYCEYRDELDITFEVEGITDDYVCEILDDGLVMNTDELRVYLARQVVEHRMDEYIILHGTKVLEISWVALPFAFIGLLLAAAAAAFTYFGSSKIVEGGFQYFLFSAMWAPANMMFSLLCFLLVPGIILDYAQGELNGGAFEQDILNLVSDTAADKIHGVFIAPFLLFGGLAFVSGILAVLFYIMYAFGKIKKRKN